MTAQVDVDRRLAVHDARLDAHSAKIRDLEIWRAQVKGFLLALTIFASLPTVILGLIAVQDRLGG